MKTNVMVLFGGRSTEHEVSIISAHQAIENLDQEKFNIIPVYIDKMGDFYYSKDNLLFDLKNYSDTKNLISKCINVTLIKEKNKTYLVSKKSGLFSNRVNILIDVAFPVVHGTNVEDGNLQGFLHTMNLPVVGPDTLSASVSMDKFVSKEYLKSVGIPVLDAIRIDKQDKDIIEKIEKIGYPIIIKPVNLGSSIGIRKTENQNELKDAIELAFTFSNVILAEKAITNLREINCAVLGSKRECIVSALEEPFGNDKILSFADKYMSGSKGKMGSKTVSKLGGSKGMASLTRKVPADIDKDKENKIKEYAVKIFKYLGLTGVSRIDFMLDGDTIYVNEINPIPGSLAYYLFEPQGISFKDLTTRLIKIAIDEFRDKENIEYVFENNLLK